MEQGVLALRFVSLDEVIPHEREDAARVQRLVDALQADGFLRNPPLVGRANRHYVVMDGTTRTQALRTLGCRDALVQVIDPDTPGFQLSTWHHAVRSVTAASLLEGLDSLPGATLIALGPDDARWSLARRELVCYVALKGIGIFGLENPSGLNREVTILNRVVDLYIQAGGVTRIPAAHQDGLSEQVPDAEALVAFRQFSQEEILSIAEAGHRVPSGITRYIIPARVLGLNVELGLLGAGSTLQHKNSMLNLYLAGRLRQGKVRLYQEPVLVIEEGSLTMSPERTEILLGNGAIARGLIESGCRMVTAYPGTPSTEIMAEVLRFKKAEALDLYADWSTNEKVALETALAASFAGQRAAVAMKQVGLNVASDALLSAAYTGVIGGLVVIACDDPGPHSSQTEQDTRLFGLFAKVPVLDPATPLEAKAMAAAAFDLSEAFEIPVILRPTTRVCHAIQSITLGEVPVSKAKPRFKKDPGRWAATPRFRYELHKGLNEKLRQIEAAFETSPFNTQQGPTSPSPLGIITGGVCSTAVREILEEAGFSDHVPVLRIGTPYPLPRQLVGDFVARCERVLVLEEPDSAIEIQIPDRRHVSGRLDGTVPGAGELLPEVIEGLLRAALEQAGIDLPIENPVALQPILARLSLPVRKPRLCPGCAHRSAFFAIKRIFPQAIFPSDIGCYTLGLNLRAVDTVIDMGAAITIATGLYHTFQLDGAGRPIVATIGDSTFFHSGVPGLVNAVHTGARFILVILDNATTAMTGFQPTAQSEQLASGAATRPVTLEGLARACGVHYVCEADPYEYEAFVEVLKEAEAHTQAESGGVAVVIARRPCVLFDPSPVKAHPVRVEVTQECDGCKYCLTAFECPALVLSPSGGRVDIDRRLCIDCGECIEGCYKGFIIPAPLPVQAGQN